MNPIDDISGNSGGSLDGVGGGYTNYAGINNTVSARTCTNKSKNGVSKKTYKKIGSDKFNEIMQQAILIDRKKKERIWNQPGKAYEKWEELREVEKIRTWAYQEIRKPRSTLRPTLDVGKKVDMSLDIGKNKEKSLDIGKIIELSDEYVEEVKNNRILLVGSNAAGEVKRVGFVKEEGLMTVAYNKELYRQFKYLDAWEGVGITLTLNCQPFNSVFNDETRIKASWAVLHRRIQRYLPEWEGNYFLVMEIGSENHMVHLHIILFGLELIPHWWLKKEWFDITGDSFIVWCSAPKSPQRAKDYVRKYLCKAMKGDIPLGIRMTWASGKRVWSASRGLFTKLEELKGERDKDGNDDDIEPLSWSVYLLLNCSTVGFYDFDECDDYG